jgi:hypothetical protein
MRREISTDTSRDTFNMTSYNNLYWTTLIDAGKKPSVQLEQLCLGLAKIIVSMLRSDSKN